jgi:hypothetical protein
MNNFFSLKKLKEEILSEMTKEERFYLRLLELKTQKENNK